MKMRWSFFLIHFIGISLIMLWATKPFVADAESVRSIETEGSIGFYGTYESEIEPKPEPPSGVSKPEIPTEMGQGLANGRLPQTGQLIALKWVWIGISLILLALISWEKKQENSNKIDFYMY